MHRIRKLQPKCGGRKLFIMLQPFFYVQQLLFKEGNSAAVKAIYTRTPFVQHCSVPEMLGCRLNKDGYIKVDPAQKTSVHGVFACGDNTTRLRTVAYAISMGTTAGMMRNK